MKSNVCKIENGIQDLDAILRESEKVAIYNELDPTQPMHLRLLCEEMDGMLPEIIDDFSGDIVHAVDDLAVLSEFGIVNRINLHIDYSLTKSAKSALQAG